MSAVPSLTTTFVPSPSCTIDVYKMPYPGITCAIGSSLIPCEYYHLGVDSSVSNCFPSGWSATKYFSPGVCPEGYTEACSSTVGAETRATCCPTGYQCQTETNWPWYSTDQCTYVMSTKQVFVYTTNIIGAGKVVSTVTDAEGLNAFGLQIRYHSTDIPSSTSSVPSSKSATNTGSAASSGPTGSSGSSGDSGSTSSSSSGLSTGAKAGIGIGAALGAVAFIGAAAWLFIRNRRAAAGNGNLSDGAELAGGAGDAANQYGGTSNSAHSPHSGIAYTAVSTSASPGLEQQQKYYYSAGASTPMAEVSGESWTPPVELPTEGQPQYLQPEQGQGQLEHR
ncbi:hypothetical protein HMPREF1624_06993 [Sporothrix schenckii ATCC 58251]|uniref:Uncharacterized protein n=1 Tax=Sporothrix schenckii (strain ATCC 58251 / de Perez 2211183) TaxID=1391915 RepID=U7PPW1_SPOS1|nr:hypothetical protein HMPREF1624_06993 [Sporothrix schenckii ATCC 58251]